MLNDSGIKTPWVVHFPDVIKLPGVSNSFISAIDLSATCLELAGVDRPDAIQGRSFLPVLKDPGTTRIATSINHPGPIRFDE